MTVRDCEEDEWMSERTQILPPVTQSDPLRGPVLLRDGRPAYLRVATKEDLPALQSMLERSSIAARYFRFLGGISPGPEGAARLMGRRTARMPKRRPPAGVLRSS